MSAVEAVRAAAIRHLRGELSSEGFQNIVDQTTQAKEGKRMTATTATPEKLLGSNKGETSA